MKKLINESNQYMNEYSLEEEEINKLNEVIEIINNEKIIFENSEEISNDNEEKIN